ncbi:hypothetical protein lerEdw1_010072 [Lerista edwardsae]|nr:hypothetical protein lerEdw1_010072 [Lerista edwardsae]
MALKAAAWILGLLALAAAQTDPSTGEVADAVWKYLAQLSSDAREVVDRLQQSEIRQQLQNAAELRGRLAPLAQELQARLRENAGGLRTSLAPYADELQQQINLQVGDLQQRLSPYVEQLKAQVDRSVAELRESLSPYAQDTQAQLARPLATLAAQVKQGAEELQARLWAQTEELRQKLSPRVQELRERLQEAGLQGSLAAYAEGLARQMDRQVEEFLQAVGPSGERFSQLLLQKVEAVRQRLSPYAGEAEDQLGLLPSDARDKLSSFLDALQREGD